MNNRFPKILILLTVILFGFVLVYQSVNVAQAAYSGLVPCGRNPNNPANPPETTKPCQPCDFFALVSNVFNFVVVYGVPAIATLLFLVAGFMILLGGGFPAQVANGRNIFKTTAIAVAIIYGSWMITNTVLKSIAGDSDYSKNWYTIVCTNPPSSKPPSSQSYTCSSQNQCVQAPAGTAGQYSNSNCDGKCQKAGGALAITATTLADATVGQSYEKFITVSGGTPPYIFYTLSGTVPPPGLDLYEDGSVSGVPTTAGQYTFTIEVDDSSSPSLATTGQIKLNVKDAAATGAKYTCSPDTNACMEDPAGSYATIADCSAECKAPVEITTTELGDAIVGKNYAMPVNAKGGQSPYTYSLNGGTLPAGLSLSNNGIITGRPTVAGSFTFMVKAQDSAKPQEAATQEFSVNVVTATDAVTISEVLINDVTQNGVIISWTTDVEADSQVEYGATRAYGSVSPRDSSTTVNHTVVIDSLTPGKNYNFRVKSSISGFNAVSSNYSFTTVAAPAVITPLAFTTTLLPDGTLGQTYSQQINVTGGAEPYSFNTTSSFPPDGLELSNDGLLTGTPTKAGSFNFVVYVGDSTEPDFKHEVQSYTMQIADPNVLPPTSSTSLAISTANLPDGTVGQNYSQKLQATGGKPPYEWHVLSGDLPRGINLAADGMLSGSPTTDYEYIFRVGLTDSVRDISKEGYVEDGFRIIIAKATAGACLFAGTNLCQGQPVAVSGGVLVPAANPVCGVAACSQFLPAINAAAVKTGISADLLKATMYKESGCQTAPRYFGSGNSYGLMQLQPGTANAYKTFCGVPATTQVDRAWLESPANSTAIVCMAAYFYKGLADGGCGNDSRNILAGYSGGTTACQTSRDCSADTSCSGEAVRKWECLYDNAAHTVCNGNNTIIGPSSKYNETRGSVINKLYCVDHPGF